MTSSANSRPRNLWMNREISYDGTYFQIIHRRHKSCVPTHRDVLAEGECKLARVPARLATLTRAAAAGNVGCVVIFTWSYLGFARSGKRYCLAAAELREREFENSMFPRSNPDTLHPFCEISRRETREARRKPQLQLFSHEWMNSEIISQSAFCAYASLASKVLTRPCPWLTTDFKFKACFEDEVSEILNVLRILLTPN